MKNRVLYIAEALLTAVAILSGAIAVPILCRWFFYLHIGPMDLADSVGLTVEQVKTAYNEMINFCTGLTDSFSAGVLPFSESGVAHFADVRRLFVLDLRVFAVSVVLLAAVALLRRRSPAAVGRHTPGFWSALGLCVTFLAVGGVAALDFDGAFTVFHRLFFPGKSNWIFYPGADPIILMLPEAFFRNCAILILALILISCSALLLWDRHKRK